ncbi:MAG: hypothetical protein DRQ55_14850 [Planctomycetota bacterium]|nr:MAG: hypothetical protein DRQ55_14850 [Planctomycetota bacterium]
MTCASALQAQDGAPTAADAQAPSQANWSNARPEVLGLTLQRRGAHSEWRLLSRLSAGTTADDHAGRAATDRAPQQVLAQGSLDACQRVLAATLLKRHGSGRINLPLPTLGGAQLWADVFWHGGWRIQRHVITFHHRLLDADDTRRAWGTAEACRAVFEQARADGRVPYQAPHQLVLLLHGLGRTRGSLQGLDDALRREGLHTLALSYPSTRASIEEHAARISGLIEQLEGVQRISFVTHSLGGIVARALLARPAGWRERLALGRVVMLAPPNRGSALAAALNGLIFEAALGPSGQQLASDAIARLPAPPCPFGIVAAGRGTSDGYNPLLPGDDDGVVSVQEALLPGAADTLIVEGLHTFLMDNEDVHAATARFLRTGRFAEPADEHERLRR